MNKYSDHLYESDFQVTENDITDLDVFFMFRESETDVRIIREPIFKFTIASHTPTIPIYQLGAHVPVGYSSGVSTYAGRILIHAFNNVPMHNCLAATKVLDGKIENIPPLDLYIINKRNSSKEKYFQDSIIKNVKFTAWNFDQGIDTPGRFLIVDFLASGFAGIHFKQYMMDSIYGLEGQNKGLSVDKVSTTIESHVNYNISDSFEFEYNDLLPNLKAMVDFYINQNRDLPENLLASIEIFIDLKDRIKLSLTQELDLELAKTGEISALLQAKIDEYFATRSQWLAEVSKELNTYLVGSMLSDDLKLQVADIISSLDARVYQPQLDLLMSPAPQFILADYNALIEDFDRTINDPTFHDLVTKVDNTSLAAVEAVVNTAIDLYIDIPTTSKNKWFSLNQMNSDMLDVVKSFMDSSYISERTRALLEAKLPTYEKQVFDEGVYSMINAPGNIVDPTNIDIPNPNEDPNIELKFKLLIRNLDKVMLGIGNEDILALQAIHNGSKTDKEFRDNLITTVSSVNEDTTAKELFDNYIGELNSLKEEILNSMKDSDLSTQDVSETISNERSNYGYLDTRDIESKVPNVIEQYSKSLEDMFESFSNGK